MLANQRSAAEAGLKYGAAGYLNTDWGDYGHLQYLPMSYPGFAAGAAMSWCLESNCVLSLPKALDVHAFGDSAGVTGAAVCDLGNVYKAVGKLIPNRSGLFSSLVPSSLRVDPMEGITREGLDAALQAIERAARNLSVARMSRPDTELIRLEVETAVAMLRHACRRGRWKLDPAGDDEADLNREVEAIVRSHRACWLARNRIGGLKDSENRLRSVAPITP
jgi:hypothetical protein